MARGKDPGRAILRVGITPDYPPIIFKRGGQIVGIEAELAQQVHSEDEPDDAQNAERARFDHRDRVEEGAHRRGRDHRRR